MENMQLTNKPEVIRTCYASSYAVDLYGCTENLFACDLNDTYLR